MAFATGKYSQAICDRCGYQYPYLELRKEWNGLLVGKDEYEPKQPQLGPFRSDVDPQALRDARPDRKEPMKVYVGIPNVEDMKPRPLQGYGIVGEVTVTT